MWKLNANFNHRRASSPAELCVFCVAFVLLWALGWKARKQNSLGKEVTFILHPRLPQAQQNSRMLGKESQWVDTAISVVKQDKPVVLQVLLSNSPSHYDTRPSI